MLNPEAEDPAVKTPGILTRQVVFPLVLDLYEFCTPEYKKELDGPRAAWQEAEDEKAGLEKAAEAADKDKAAEV